MHDRGNSSNRQIDGADIEIYGSFIFHGNITLVMARPALKDLPEQFNGSDAELAFKNSLQSEYSASFNVSSNTRPYGIRGEL